jgi:2-methylisocitrate lyase-like PEP mutase family enzyme
MGSETRCFRELTEAEETLLQPGIYDGAGARLVQQMGFKSAAISGTGVSETTLGWAEVGLMDDEESLHASRAIAACVDIPVSADADTGYAAVAHEVGEPLAVRRGFGIRSRPTKPLLSARELQELGVAVVGYPRMVTGAANQGMKNALAVPLQSAAEGQVIERPDLAVAFPELNDLLGFATIRDMEQRFLTVAQREAKCGATR